MDTPEYCFFCCEPIQHDFLNNLEQKNDKRKLHSISPSDTNCPIKRKSVRQSVLQISQYLKVPRNKLAEFKENKLSKVSVCEDCKEISENLSKLCSNVEVTKMKISYYLNLLTDRIVGIKNNAISDDEGDKQQITRKEAPLSDLQKTVHQKCKSN